MLPSLSDLGHTAVPWNVLSYEFLRQAADELLTRSR
jgi:hypothetical protein